MYYLAHIVAIAYKRNLHYLLIRFQPS